MNQAPFLPRLAFLSGNPALEGRYRSKLEMFPWTERPVEDVRGLGKEARSALVFLVGLPDWERFRAELEGEPDQSQVLHNSIALEAGRIPDERKLAVFLSGAAYVADDGTPPDDLRCRIESLLSAKSRLVARQIAMERLRARIARQQEQLRYQNDFLHMAVHDLRSPLAAMICYAELLMEGVLGNLEVTQLEPIRTIHRNCQFLVDMVTDLLDSAKLGAGKLQLKLERVNFLKELQHIIQSLRGLAMARGIRIELKADPVPELYLDVQKISRVLANLLGNAIKFTKTNGKIVVKVQQRDNNLVCAIQDMGPGIPQADLGAIFEKFETGSGSNITGKGHGLGLTISRSFVELHGGRLYVESTRHKGSVFIVNLPIEKRRTTEQPRIRKRILVLDLGRDVPDLSRMGDQEAFARFQIEYLPSTWSTWQTSAREEFDFVLVNEAREVPESLRDFYLLALGDMSADAPSALIVDSGLAGEDKDLRRYLGFQIIEKPCTTGELFDKLQSVIGTDRRAK